MSLYTVIRPTGDYRARIATANEAGAALYLEQHFNGGVGPYSLAKYIRGDEASAELAREYARVVLETCSHLSDWHAWEMFTGEGSTEDSRRGYYNLSGVRCPAILMEPGFVGEPTFAAWAQSRAGVEALARAIVHVVRGAVPKGGTIALSVGHVGKVSSPGDRGAPIVGGGWEADLATVVVDRAADMLREG